MILRRIIQHLRKQEWTAIGIDFVIVVVGVFVGLQVSNLNEARANRGIVDRHLAEIVEDLDSHLALHDALYGSALARIAAVDYINEHAFGRELPRTLVLSTESWEAPRTAPIHRRASGQSVWGRSTSCASPSARASLINCSPAQAIWG